MLQQLFADEVLYWVKEDRPGHAVVAPVPVGPSEAEVIAPAPIAGPIEEQKKPVFRYQHKVLVVAGALSEADRELLEKILKAINLTLAEIDVLILSDYPDTDLKPLLAEKTVHHVISFGVALSKIGLSVLLTPYQVSRVSGINFLYADPFVNLHQEAPKKKLLWGALKAIFGV